MIDATDFGPLGYLYDWFGGGGGSDSMLGLTLSDALVIVAALLAVALLFGGGA